jgi:hypothetical protein
VLVEHPPVVDAASTDDTSALVAVRRSMHALRLSVSVSARVAKRHAKPSTRTKMVTNSGNAQVGIVTGDPG